MRAVHFQKSSHNGERRNQYVFFLTYIRHYRKYSNLIRAQNLSALLSHYYYYYYYYYFATTCTPANIWNVETIKYLISEDCLIYFQI